MCFGIGVAARGRSRRRASGRRESAGRRAAGCRERRGSRCRSRPSGPRLAGAAVAAGPVLALLVDARAPGGSASCTRDSEWQRPQKLRHGRTLGRAAEGAVGVVRIHGRRHIVAGQLGSGLPPWQSWQERPTLAWTSAREVVARSAPRRLATCSALLWQADTRSCRLRPGRRTGPASDGEQDAERGEGSHSSPSRAPDSAAAGDEATPIRTAARPGRCTTGDQRMVAPRGQDDDVGDCQARRRR